MSTEDDTRRRLVWHGMLLFLLGLLTGLAEPRFAKSADGVAGSSRGRYERHFPGRARRCVGRP
jgi:hypothetical protein